MSNDSKPPKEPGAASLVRLDYRVPSDSADDYWVVQHLTARRASYQAPFHTQSFPLVVEARAKEGASDPNEALFFGDQIVQPASGTLTFAATEESDKIAATGQVTLKVSATLDAVIAVDKPTRKIELPPGSGMLAFARNIFSTEQVEEVFEAIIADYQHDYFEAMRGGADKHTLAAIDQQYWGDYGWAFVRELGPVIWRLIVAIGVALKIAG